MENNNENLKNSNSENSSFFEQKVSSSNGNEDFIPKLRFKGFCKNWSCNNMGSLGSFTKGAPLSKADISKTGFPFILYGELYTTYKEVTYHIYRQTDANAPKECFSKIGDVIIPTSGETPEEIATATCVMVPDVILGGDLNIYRNDAVDGRIISYIINHKINKCIAKVAQGKSVVHIKADDLSKMNIKYPEKDEQAKIINFLLLIDKKIEKQCQLIESLKKYKRGLFNKIFSSFIGEYITLENILVEVNEKSKIKNEYPIISSTKQGLFLQSDYFNKQAASENTIGYKILRKGQIVFSPQNLWMGNINYNSNFEIGIVSPSYKIYQINKKFNPYFIGVLLKEPIALKEYMLASEQGASIVRRNLNLELFNNIKFKIPTLEIQDKLAVILQIANTIIDKEELYLSMLNQYKNGLLQQMFI